MCKRPVWQALRCQYRQLCSCSYQRTLDEGMPQLQQSPGEGRRIGSQRSRHLAVCRILQDVLLL